jgi:hypothetical protein
MVSDSDVKQGGSNPKRRRLRRLWYLVPLALVMLLTIAAVSVHNCTLIGADSGVSFDLKPILAHASGPVHIYGCVAGSCGSVTFDRCGHTCVPIRPWDGRWDWYSASSLWLLNPGLTSSAPVAVRLNVKDQDGNSLFDSTAVVQLRRWQPNGAFCSPTVYQGSVVATLDGRLVPQP